MRRFGLVVISAMVVIGLFAASANAASRRYYVLNATSHDVKYKGATEGEWRMGDEGHPADGTVLSADKAGPGLPAPGNNNALMRWSHVFYELKWPYYEAILKFEVDKDLDVEFQIWNEPFSNSSRCRQVEDGKPRKSYLEWSGGTVQCLAKEEWLVIYDRQLQGPSPIGCLFKPRLADGFWKEACHEKVEGKPK